LSQQIKYIDVSTYLTYLIKIVSFAKLAFKISIVYLVTTDT